MPGKGGDLINHHLLGPAGQNMRDVLRVRREVDLEFESRQGKRVTWNDVRKRYSLSANYWPQTQYRKGVTK